MNRIFSMLIVMLVSTSVWAGSLVQSPSTNAQNTINPHPSVTGLTINGATGNEPALNVTNNQAYDAIDAFSLNSIALYAVSTNSVALYSYSAASYGIQSSSSNSSSAYFQSEASSNAQPTVLIQSIGGSADLLEVQAFPSGVLLSVDANGALHASSGLQLDTVGAQPTCNSTNRGMLFLIEGASGVQDQLQICIKESTDAYSWNNIAL